MCPVFYYLCYEGAVDLDDIKELTKRHAIEVQISEFGQIPKQLFDKPHVARLVNTERESRQSLNSVPEELSLCTRDFSQGIQFLWYNYYYMLLLLECVF